MPKQISNEQLYDLMEDVYAELPRAQRRYAVEDNQPAKAAPKERKSNVIGAVMVFMAICLIVGLLPFAWKGAIWASRFFSTTTAPQSQPTTQPTQPASGGGAFAQPTPTPAPAAATTPPADPSYLAVVSSQQRRLRADGLPCAPRDSDAGCAINDPLPTLVLSTVPCVADAGGVNLAISAHVGSDSARLSNVASVSNGVACPTPTEAADTHTETITPHTVVLVPTIAPAIVASYTSRGSGTCPAGQVFVPRVGCHVVGSGGAMPGAVMP